MYKISKMPKIYEYLGIIVFFYSNEHEPIHVHARKGEFESKAAFLIEKGVVTEVRITMVKGSKPLRGNDLSDFKVFLEAYANKIVEKWVNYFVYHQNVEFEKISKRLK